MFLPKGIATAPDSIRSSAMESDIEISDVEGEARPHASTESGPGQPQQQQQHEGPRPPVGAGTGPPPPPRASLLRPVKTASQNFRQWHGLCYRPLGQQRSKARSLREKRRRRGTRHGRWLKKDS